MILSTTPAWTQRLKKQLPRTSIREGVGGGLLNDAEFKQKLLEERAVYQRILNPTTQ